MASGYDNYFIRCEACCLTFRSRELYCEHIFRSFHMDYIYSSHISSNGRLYYQYAHNNKIVFHKEIQHIRDEMAIMYKLSGQELVRRNEIFRSLYLFHLGEYVNLAIKEGTDIPMGVTERDHDSDIRNEKCVTFPSTMNNEGQSTSRPDNGSRSSKVMLFSSKDTGDQSCEEKTAKVRPQPALSDHAYWGKYTEHFKQMQQNARRRFIAEKTSLLENRQDVFDRMQTFFLKMGRPYDYLTDGPIPYDLSDGDPLVIEHVVDAMKTVLHRIDIGELNSNEYVKELKKVILVKQKDNPSLGWRLDNFFSNEQPLPRMNPYTKSSESINKYINWLYRQKTVRSKEYKENATSLNKEIDKWGALRKNAFEMEEPGPSDPKRSRTISYDSGVGGSGYTIENNLSDNESNFSLPDLPEPRTPSPENSPLNLNHENGENQTEEGTEMVENWNEINEDGGNLSNGEGEINEIGGNLSNGEGEINEIGGNLSNGEGDDEEEEEDANRENGEDVNIGSNFGDYLQWDDDNTVSTVDYGDLTDAIILSSDGESDSE